LLARSKEDVIEYLLNLSDKEARQIGRRSQERVLAEHSAEKRAIQFEEYVGAKSLASQYV